MTQRVLVTGTFLLTLAWTMIPGGAQTAPPARTAPAHAASVQANSVQATSAHAAPAHATPAAEHGTAMFMASDECLACHNGLTTPSGEDVSIGVSWRASMMANSGRDPYWLAGVRRETIDHPSHQADIEDECSVCHMPMARTAAVAEGRRGTIFEHVQRDATAGEHTRLAADGVSCMLCHQIGPDRLGTPDSFTGGYVIGPPAEGRRHMLGPYRPDDGRASIMASSTGVQPAEGTHVREAALCATCHTLITQAFGPGGEVIGRLPEQVPYQEWRHSAWRGERTCQGCHMPPVGEPTPITSVFGEPRERMGRHTFLGGNFLMLRLLNRHRVELGVQALPQEMEATARATIRQLQADTAAVRVVQADRAADRVRVEVEVANLTGHKLPTGYPARRAWLHLTLTDRDGRTVFESGAVSPQGAIQGNDADAEGDRFEPHHEVIRSADEVQIYESVMGDREGRPTTGLLSATRFLKDNRLLPRGFDKATAEDDIAVRGEAATDGNFTGAGDRVRYEIPVGDAAGPFDLTVELLYQPIAYRWVQNLSRYNAPETQRFVSYYAEAAPASATSLVRARARVE